MTWEYSSVGGEISTTSTITETTASAKTKYLVKYVSYFDVLHAKVEECKPAKYYVTLLRDKNPIVHWKHFLKAMVEKD